MDNTKMEKMALFYEQCQAKGYTNMEDETQSLKAKVIATDLGLKYGRIGSLYKDAAKAYEAVKAEREKTAQKAKKESVVGELLVTLYEKSVYSPSNDSDDKICVYIRPDGSIYSTYNNGPKMEGSPRVELVQGGYTSYSTDPVQTSYVGTTVGNNTFISGMETGGGLSKKERSTNKGYIKVAIGEYSFEIGLIESSKYTCDSFKRDQEFNQLRGSSISFWNYEGKAQADYLRSSAHLASGYGNLTASSLGLTYLNQAEDELRLPYEKCQRIITLLRRIVQGKFPPSDEELYKKACSLYTADKFPELKEAYETFELISDYKDSKEKAEAIRPKYEELLQEEKEKNVLKAEKQRKTIVIIAVAGVAIIAVCILLMMASARASARKEIETLQFGDYYVWEDPSFYSNSENRYEMVIFDAESIDSLTFYEMTYSRWGHPNPGWPYPDNISLQKRFTYEITVDAIGNIIIRTDGHSFFISETNGGMVQAVREGNKVYTLYE